MKYAILILCLLATPAWANCKQKDLQGTWRVYAGVSGEIGVCVLKIAKNGKIRGGTGCVGTEASPTILGGRLKLRRNCTFDGFVSDTTGTSDVPAGSLAGDVMTGLVLAPTAYHFTAIR